MKTYAIFAGLILFLLAPKLSAQDHYQEMIQGKIAECRKAVQQQPNNAQAQKELAYVLETSNYKQVGNVVYTNNAPASVQDEAIRHLTKAVSLEPNHYDWQSSLGLYLNNRGRYQEAIPHLKQSLYLLGLVKPISLSHGGWTDQTKHAESVWSTYGILGDALAKLGRYHEAAEYYQQALKFDSTSCWVLLGLGNALNGEGKRPQARDAWQKIVLLNPKPNFYFREARRKLALFPAVP